MTSPDQGGSGACDKCGRLACPDKGGSGAIRHERVGPADPERLQALSEQFPLSSGAGSTVFGGLCGATLTETCVKPRGHEGLCSYHHDAQLRADLEAALKPIADTYSCEACGRRDGLDAVLPNELWERVRRGQNLLCLWCLDTRAAESGIKASITLQFSGRALFGSSQSATDQEHVARLATSLEAAQGERDQARVDLDHMHRAYHAIEAELAQARVERDKAIEEMEWAEQTTDRSEADLAQARARLDSIRALHQPITDGENAGFCDGCDWGWPCPTTQALDTAQAAGGEEAHDPSARTD
jgi:hypothetical protein